MSENCSSPPARGRSEAQAQRLSPSAAQLHDWNHQPPRLTARDLAHTAGVDPEPAHLVDAIHAALSVPVRNWETGPIDGNATDERDEDMSWAIAITIGGLPFTVPLRWQIRNTWKRWLIGCAGCDRWRRALYLVGGRLQCKECGGVRVPETACPAILKPVKALSRAEAAQLAERKYRKDQRKFARIAGAQVFPGGSVGCKVAQTFDPRTQGQSNDGDADD